LFRRLRRRCDDHRTWHFGRRETDEGPEYMVASESVALDLLQFEKLRDIGPGETVFIENEGVMHSREYDGATSYSPCIFEFVYFARPDSIIDNLSVYKRHRCRHSDS
jgi:amidophosphoribosyltransferase